MDVKPTAAESAVNRDNPERANLAQEDPLFQPDKARPRNTLHQRLSVGRAGGKDVNLPGTCNGHPIGASLSSPWCRTRTKTQRVPFTSPGQGPRFPDPRNTPATEKPTAPSTDLSFHLTPLSREPDPQGVGPGGQSNTQDPRLGP